MNGLMVVFPFTRFFTFYPSVHCCCKITMVTEMFFINHPLIKHLALTLSPFPSPWSDALFKMPQYVQMSVHVTVKKTFFPIFCRQAQVTSPLQRLSRHNVFIILYLLTFVNCNQVNFKKSSVKQTSKMRFYQFRSFNFKVLKLRIPSAWHPSNKCFHILLHLRNDITYERCNKNVESNSPNWTVSYSNLYAPSLA